jgi:hypothetical protein
MVPNWGERLAAEKGKQQQQPAQQWLVTFKKLVFHLLVLICLALLRSAARTRISTAAAPRAPRHLSRGDVPVNPSYHSQDHNHSNSENRNYNHYWRSTTTTNLRYSAAKFSAAFPSRNLQGVPLWKRRHSRPLSQALRNGHLKRSLTSVPQQSFPNVTIIAEAVVSGGGGPLPQYRSVGYFRATTAES